MSFETLDDVLENLFLDIVTCSKEFQSTFAMCVLELLCVSPDLHCTASVIVRISWASRLPGSFFDHVLGNLGNILVLLAAVFWTSLSHQFCPSSETQGFVFCVRRLSTDLILHAF